MRLLARRPGTPFGIHLTDPHFLPHFLNSFSPATEEKVAVSEGCRR